MIDTQSILAQALEHHQAGRREQAAALYQQALDADPHEPTALYLSGLLNFETGHVEAAADLLRRVVEVRPSHAEARFTLASLQHWRGDRASAIEGYRAVIELRPAHLAARVGLANALRDSGELKAALIASRDALEVGPQAASAHEALGGILSGLGRAAEAIEAYRGALALQPDLASAQVGLALALLGAGRANDALVAADAALALDDGPADAWFARGAALKALRRPLEAIAALEQAAARDPGQALTHLNLGNLYGELERGGEAIDHLREAVSLDPMLKEAHASLGSIYLLTGQKAEAERSSWLALAIDPDMIAPHLNLASLLAEKGQIAQARHHRDAAYGRQNLFVDEAEHPRRRVLILSTAESGNVPFKFLLPQDRFTRINWIVEYATEDQASELPLYDLVFNAIGDPDLAGPTRAPVERFLAVQNRPVFNDPGKISRTFRHLIPKLLADLPDVQTPKTLRLTAEAVAQTGLAEQIADARLTWPLLIRPIGSHGGKGLIRVEGSDDLAQADLPRDRDLYVTAFRDYRSPDGAWRKYRMIFIDRRPYPYHAAISDNWLVHYETAAMLERPERLAEELRFLEDPLGAIGDKAMKAVEAIGRRLDLDYCGVDFSVLPDGSVLVFEANATMLAHPEKSDSVLAPKNPHVQRIFNAFEAMIEP
jgi:tetratricopeptide (TPR) repeat protein